MKSMYRQLCLILWFPLTALAQPVMNTASVEPFSVRMLNTYEVLNTPSELANHPLMNTEVTFTAVVSGIANNTGLPTANSPIVLGLPQRLHLFVVDTMATEFGNYGMSMQIVETLNEPMHADMSTLLLGATRGTIMTFTGRLTYVVGQVQFDLTQMPVVVGHVDDASFKHHKPLLEPHFIHTFMANRVDSLTGILVPDMSMYTALAHSYVTLGMVDFTRHTMAGVLRPQWSASDPFGTMHIHDSSGRFRNDKEGLFWDVMNFRRAQGSEGFFTPPETGSKGVVSGFIVYTSLNVNGFMLPTHATLAPWYDGVLWAGMSRTTPDWMPNDLVLDTTVVSDERMVEFRVATDDLMSLELFDPMFDAMFVRGSFNGWETIRMSPVAWGVFGTSVSITGMEGDTLRYKYYYMRPGSEPTFNDGWEVIGDDPNTNRIAILGPPDVTQSLNDSFGIGVLPTPDSRLITFTVDVTPLVDAGFFDVMNDTLVSIAGSFSDWGTLPMQRQSPTLWTTTINLSGAEGDTIDYKFVYSRLGGEIYNYGYEIIDPRELLEGIYVNRRLVLGPKDVPVVLDAVYFGVVILDEGPLAVNLSQLNYYDVLDSPADIPNHPLMGVEVRFTAAVSGMALNSGMAGLNPIMADLPARLHLFVVDTTAYVYGRPGMGMQIVEAIEDPEMYATLLGAHRGDIYTFTGRMGVFNGVQVQFDLTQLPVYVGSILQDVDFAHLGDLLEPMQTGTFILNERRADSLHQINMRMYSVFAHQYVYLGGAFHRFSGPGAPRPVWAFSGDGDMIGLGDMSLRFRNDREGVYPPHMNYRRIAVDSLFTPPDLVRGTVRGFVSYVTNREPDGSSGPNPTAIVNPWYDGVIWLDGNRSELSWIPDDVVADGDSIVVPDDTRIVSFTVSMSSLIDQGWFDAAEDRVFLRVSFADWMPLRMNRISDDSYRVMVQVPGAEGDTVQYKFFYESVTGHIYNGGWEMLSTDPFHNRLLVLGKPGVDVTLDDAIFGFVPIEPPVGLIPVYMYTPSRFAPGDADGNWLFIGLGSEEIPAVDLIGMGFRLYFDTTFVVPKAYTTLGVFDDGIDTDYLDLFEFTADGAGMSIVRTAGTNKLPYGPVIGVRFEVKEQTETVDVWIGEIDIRNSQGELIPFHLMQHGLSIPTRLMAIWPGDTNADGTVDVFDVEPIAYGFGETGPARIDRSIQWMAIDAPLWDQRELVHADATGDGVINQNDLLPVGYNFGKSVSVPAKELAAHPYIRRPESVDIALPAMREGETLELPLFADPTFTGTADLRSFAFRLNIDATRLRVESVLPAVGFDATGTLRMIKSEPAIDRYSAAYSRTRDMGTVDVDGPLVRVLIRALADLPLDATLTVEQSMTAIGDARAMPARLFVPDGTITSVDDPRAAVPTRTRLDGNYPNPFNPSTVIAYALAIDAPTRLSVFDVLGREVAVLVDAHQSSGAYQVVFDATEFSSGIYLIRLQVGSDTFIKRMTLVK